MNYLFVCTGNTCRSPMAQCLMAHFSGESCQSAGLYALPGAPATKEAVQAMAALGLDLTGHRAQPVTRQLLQWADQVWAMTPAHLQALRQAFPHFEAKYLAFSPAIPDPYGGDMPVYERTAQALARQLRPMAQSLEKT